jgi:hypothetical protein
MTISPGFIPGLIFHPAPVFILAQEITSHFQTLLTGLVEVFLTTVLYPSNISIPIES